MILEKILGLIAIAVGAPLLAALVALSAASYLMVLSMIFNWIRRRRGIG